MPRAGEIIGRHIEAGEGIHIRPQGGKLRRHIPTRQLEHLMLQEMGHAGRLVIFPAIQDEILMNGTKIRDKIGQRPGKPLFRHDFYRQAVG